MRRLLTTMLVFATAMLAGTVVSAKAQDAPAPAAPPQRQFNGDGGLVLLYVKPEKAADFETAMSRVKEALNNSDKPERKQQAAGWKLYKAGAGSAGQVYVFVIQPSVKNVDYSLGAILTDGLPQEARAIYDAYAESLAAQPQVVIPMDLVNDFSQ